MPQENKVKFGIKNCHYAVLTETIVDNQTVYSYGTPKRWPGAVSLSLDMQGGLQRFYADDIAYYVTYSHQGYEGDLEVAEIPESVASDIFRDEKDSSGVSIETNLLQPKEFAFLFEFDGDQKATRHVLYKCTLTRPGLSGQTKEDTAEPQTSTLTLSAAPRADGVVHAKTTSTTDETAYNGWYDEVHSVTVTPTKVSSITLSETTLNLTVEGSSTLTATVLPEDADNKNIVWGTSDAAVATVSGGVVTGVAAGTATITAIAADGSGVSATCSVTVTE